MEQNPKNSMRELCLDGFSNSKGNLKKDHEFSSLSQQVLNQRNKDFIFHNIHWIYKTQRGTKVLKCNE